MKDNLAELRNQQKSPRYFVIAVESSLMTDLYTTMNQAQQLHTCAFILIELYTAFHLLREGYIDSTYSIQIIVVQFDTIQIYLHLV